MRINLNVLKSFIAFSIIFPAFLFINFSACGNSTTQDSPDTGSPSIPLNLKTTSILSYRVSLAWDASTDNKGVTGYRVYRDGSAIGTSANTTYSDTSVSASVSYAYTVSAYDAANNESGKSDGINVTTPAGATEPTIIDHRFTDASVIPDTYITAAKSNLHIAYQHTSHGSQIISGMDALEAYAPYNNRYEWSDNGSEGLDLDYYDPIMAGYHDLSTEDSENANGDTPWTIATRTFLDNTSNYHINVVMWSWCSINGHNISRYITNMEKLISEYGVGGSNARAAAHPVEFVFMTGHSQGQGESGFVAQAAATIREHCVNNNRWLIDYYDIECYDPTGNYYGDKNITDNLAYVAGNWAIEYINANDGSILDILTMGDGGSFSGCTSCAHSDTPRQATLNCVLKGQAAWQLFARIAGWEGN
ncbi:MAG: hypothetical protein V1874_05765 [Spirochaetota bacterium]